MLPLTNADILAPLIVGFAAEKFSSGSQPPEHETPQLEKHKKRVPHRPGRRQASPLADLSPPRSDSDAPDFLSSIIGPTGDKSSSGSRPPEHEAPKQEKHTNQEPERPGRPQTPMADPPLSESDLDAPDLAAPSYSIILQNSSDESIQFQYEENGIPISGALAPGQRGPKPTIFLAFTQYEFSITKGEIVKSFP